MSDALVARAAGYGVVGDYFLSLARQFPSAFAGYGGISFVADLIHLQSSISSLKPLHPLLPAAVSLLALPFPLQVPVEVPDITMIAVTASGVPFNYVHSAVAAPGFLALFPGLSSAPPSAQRSYVYRHLKDADFLRTCFPVKKLTAASTKVNLDLPRLVESAVRMGLARVIVGLTLLLGGTIYEDQVMGCILYGFGLAATFGQKGWDISAHFALHPKVAKNVSVALKALGCNSTREGAILVEADTLQGRNAGPISLTEEALYRCNANLVAEKVIPASSDLRSHIKAIIDSELADRNCTLPDIHEWWSARWLWCVNGSQTATSSRAMGLDPKRNAATHNQDYRRMASEALVDEPVTAWDGVTHVSQSLKLENGKQRAIFACDTNSYFAFSWIIGAAEKLWRNDRVLLNPGLGGNIGIVRRIKRSQAGGGVNLMLDYDDFNSHHSTATMQMVFDVLCARFGAPGWYRDLLVNSFDSMYLKIDGVRQRVMGTLMSGHRGTTFINSILNAAYIRAAVGGAAYSRMLSLHAGDDVYIRANTLSDCERVLYASKTFGCRMNPTKQSIGFVGAEFLRVGIGVHSSFGYYARGVSSFVSGNWVTFDILKPLEGLQNAVSGCRTLINRSGCPDVARLVAPALRWTRGVGTRTLIRLLKGEMALEGAPVYNTDGMVRNLSAKVTTPDKNPLPTSWARNASVAYLSNHVSDIEATAIGLAGADALPLLVASSYSKGLNQIGKELQPQLRLKPVVMRRARGYAAATDLLNVKHERGVLVGYPVIRLFENRLSSSDLRTLVFMAGGDHTAHDIREVAFGKAATTKNIIGFLSFGDAASISTRTNAGNIYVLHNIYL